MKTSVLSLPAFLPVLLLHNVLSVVQAADEYGLIEVQPSPEALQACANVSNTGELDFQGVLGTLVPGDCHALWAFMGQATEAAQAAGRSNVVYVETGSFLGCSANIAATAAETVAQGSPRALVYAHDLWQDELAPRAFDTLKQEMDVAGTVMSVDGTVVASWERENKGDKPAPEEQPPAAAGPGTGSHAPAPVRKQSFFYLSSFYSSVRRLGREHEIIPIVGNSPRTLAIHEPGSVDLAFVDGDHSYEGSLADMEAAWPLLRAGGVMLGHDTVEHEDAAERSSFVRKAVADFCESRGLTWHLVEGTWYMFAVFKPEE